MTTQTESQLPLKTVPKLVENLKKNPQTKKEKKSSKNVVALENQMRPKHVVFAIAYVKNGGNAISAALEAGATAQETGYKWLQRDDVRNYIKEVQHQLTEKTKITIEWKMQKLKEVVDTSLTPQYDSNGLAQYKLDTAVTAIRELNKMQGDYAPEKHLNLNVSAEIDRVADLIAQYERPY